MSALPSPGLPAVAPFLRRYRAVVLALGAGTALSLTLFSVMRDGERRERQARVEAAARQRLELLRESMGNSLEALHSLAALFSTGLPVDREKFRAFTASVLERHPELQALSWSPKVPAESRAAIEADMRMSGFPDFQFRERDNDTHQLGPAQERNDNYVVLLLIEPLERNFAVLGHTSKLRAGTIVRALDSGKMAASSIAPLHHDDYQTVGFSVFLPLYDGPIPATPEERRAKHLGHVAATFRTPNFVESALARIPGLNVDIRDPRPDARTVPYSVPRADNAAPRLDLAPCTLPLPVADREFLVTFTPTASFHSPPELRSALLTLVSGLVITALAAAYLATWARRNADIARANAALQSEVAERKHAEEAAAAANRAKSDFVSSLSHEIRTPLNTILGYTQILERDARLGAEHREMLRVVVSSGRHLLGLLDSILDLSRIEAGRVELQRVAFDLPALFDGLAAMFKPRCAGKPFTLRFECGVPAGRGAVLGDEGKLRQVLINLISNAVKFTSSGEIVVIVRPCGGADYWRFEVRDTGIGMAPAERANLFTRFHQTAAGRRLGGTGLGLAIARGHVELMGGHLQVESERGTGTRFFFRVPLAAAVLARASSPSDPLPRLAPGTCLRALVVDDDRDNRQILARWLRDLGCAIAEAGTARDARDLVRAAPPDVLFLDVFLAETTGPELLAALRADGLPVSTPVLLHTAALLTREQRESLQAAGADLLQKPFRIEDLCACLRRVPGVRFESSSSARSPIATATPLDLASVNVPEDLRERMTVAAEMHSTTVLKACLQELRQLGGPAEALAEHLRLLVRAYDLAAIVELLRRLPSGSELASASVTDISS